MRNLMFYVTKDSAKEASEATSEERIQMQHIQNDEEAKSHI